MRFAPLAFAAVLVAATLPGFAGANQTYTLPDGRTVAFNDGGGNEWWVQVRLSGTAGGASCSPVCLVESRYSRPRRRNNRAAV